MIQEECLTHSRHSINASYQEVVKATQIVEDSELKPGVS